MTISSIISRNDYVGTGSLDTYDYTFKIFQDEDLLVTTANTSGVETTLTLTTDYTVTGAGDEDGGSIVLLAGNLTTNYALTIRRVVNLTQEADIRNQGPFFPEIHEDEFDKLTMIAQQQQDSIDRSLKLPETVDPSDFDMTFPSDIVGAINVCPMTNDAGDGFADATDWPSAGSIASAEGFAEDAAESATEAAASAAAAAAAAGLSAPYGLVNLGLATSVGSSALTIALKQFDGSTDPTTSPSNVSIAFRSSTLTSGTNVVRSVTAALSVVVVSGATLGHNDALADYIYIYAIDNAGTVELAVSSSSHWDQGTRYSTSAMGTGSDDGATLYSTSARTNVAIRLIGRLLSTQSTAGTWASGMTEVYAGNIPREPKIFTMAANFIPKHGIVYELSTASARSVSLPAPRVGWLTTIKDSTLQSSTNNITLVRNGSEKIEGVAASFVLASSGGAWVVWSDGTDWFVQHQTNSAANGAVIVDTGNGHGSTNNKIRRFSNTRLSSGTSITYADSSTDGGSFTINQAGVYSISYCDGMSGTDDQVIGISLNSAALTTAINSLSYANGKRAVAFMSNVGGAGDNPITCASWTGRLAVNDVIRAHTSGGVDANNDNVLFSICQVSKL